MGDLYGRGPRGRREEEAPKKSNMKHSDEWDAAGTKPPKHKGPGAMASYSQEWDDVAASQPGSPPAEKGRMSHYSDQFLKSGPPAAPKPDERKPTAPKPDEAKPAAPVEKPEEGK